MEMVAVHHGSRLYQMNMARTQIYSIFRSFRLNNVSHWWTVYATKTRPSAGDLPHILREHKGPSHLCPPLSIRVHSRARGHRPELPPPRPRTHMGPPSAPTPSSLKSQGPALTGPVVRLSSRGTHWPSSSFLQKGQQCIFSEC